MSSWIMKGAGCHGEVSVTTRLPERSLSSGNDEAAGSQLVPSGQYRFALKESELPN